MSSPKNERAPVTGGDAQETGPGSIIAQTGCSDEDTCAEAHALHTKFLRLGLACDACHLPIECEYDGTVEFSDDDSWVLHASCSNDALALLSHNLTYFLDPANADALTDPLYPGLHRFGEWLAEATA